MDIVVIFVLGEVGIPDVENNTCKSPEAFESGVFFRLLEETYEGSAQALNGKMRTYPDIGAAPTAYPALI